MLLTERELKSLIRGAYRFVEREGYLSFCHYTVEQAEYLAFNRFFYDRAFFSSSVTVEFETEATEIAFAYKIFEVGSKDSVDVYVNDKVVGIASLQKLPEEGDLKFALPAGKKKVVVYLPIDLVFAIKDFKIDGAWRGSPRRKTKVLWMGDSITQGYGTFLTGHTYVNVANRRLEYDILNQGIGGYYYDGKVLKPMAEFKPDKIIVALGINGHKSPNKKEMIFQYYEALTSLYPQTPILAITPLWAEGDWVDMQGVLDTAKYVREAGEKYPQMQVIDGFTLLPHTQEYFFDGVHPNAIGGETYGQNLAKEIKRLGF